MKDIIQIKGEMTAEQHKRLMDSIKKHGDSKTVSIDNSKPAESRVIVVNETKIQVGFAEPTCNVETKRASKSLTCNFERLISEHRPSYQEGQDTTQQEPQKYNRNEVRNTPNNHETTFDPSLNRYNFSLHGLPKRNERCRHGETLHKALLKSNLPLIQKLLAFGKLYLFPRSVAKSIRLAVQQYGNPRTYEVQAPESLLVGLKSNASHALHKI